MRSRPSTLAFSLLVALLVALALLVDDPVRAFENPVSATEDGLVERLELGTGGDLRLEAFTLVPRGRRWEAERAVIGSASLLRGTAEGRPQLELDQRWGSSGTRVRRVLRGLDGPGQWSYVFREWRAADEGRIDGRGLVLDAEHDGVLHLREWAAREQRSELLLEAAVGDRRAAALTPLGLVEARRRHGGPPAQLVQAFEPIEARLAPTLVLETHLAPGLLRGLRIVDLATLESGPDGRPRLAGRPSRWLLFGPHLLGWLEGDLEAVRDPSSELVARR